MFRLTVPVLLVCLTRSPVAHCQSPQIQRVVLAVSDSVTRAPLPNVRVARDSVTLAVTDPAGRAVFSIPSTERRPRLTLTRLGFQPRALTLPERPTDSLELSVAMNAIPQQLAPVDVRDSAREFVSPRLTGYERRRTSGRGTYITREMIEKKNRVRTIDLFRGYPGFRVVDSLYDQHVAGSRGSKPIARGGLHDLAPCVFRVAIDGVLTPWGFQVNMIDPKEIHGIEVYSDRPQSPRSSRPRRETPSAAWSSSGRDRETERKRQRARPLASKMYALFPIPYPPIP